VNVLKAQKRQDLLSLARAGFGFREIARRLGIHRETVTRYARSAGLRPAEGVEDRPKWPPDPPEARRSLCEPHRAWVEQQVLLGRNAVSIYQDLVDQHGFSGRYNSVKRFVRGLKRREPEAYDVLEFRPGEEAQVDYGQGALTLNPQTGRYVKPILFVMTLRFSRRSFRKTVFKTDQVIWARLHEEAFRYFGGVPQYVVLDNLKEGVIRPDLYEPTINATYAALLGHYGAIADPARVRDPNRKGTVEKAIDHTQSTALKGRRFESIEGQNTHLMHWEERWAAQRVHGRAKRKVEEMFQEEKPFLKPLPVAPFRFFTQEERTVGSDGLVEVKRAYYAAPPRFVGRCVPVRIYDTAVAILNPETLETERYYNQREKGTFTIRDEDRRFNPSRESLRILERVASIGPNTEAFAREMLREQGRPAQRRLQGLAALARRYERDEIEWATSVAVRRASLTCRSVRLLLEKRTRDTEEPQLIQAHDLIRQATEYSSLFNRIAEAASCR